MQIFNWFRVRSFSFPKLGEVSSRLKVAAFALAGSLALMSSAHATQESFELSTTLNADLLSVQGDVQGPEGDWDRTKSVLAGSGVVALTPNDQSLDSTRITQMLALSKDLYLETVAASTGQIGTWLDNQTLYAVEFDLFGTSDPVSMPSSTEYLGSVATLTGLDANGQPATLGKMYCYDLAKFNARVAALAAQSGGGLSVETKIYPGPLLQASGGGRYAMHLPSKNSLFQGAVRSNGGLRLAGNDNDISGRMISKSTMEVIGTGHTYDEEIIEGTAAELMATQRTAAQYETLASSNSTFFNSSVTLVNDGAGGVETSQGLPVSGVVYSAGDITVAFSGITVSLTLVAEGSIEFSGGNNTVNAAVDDLLTWAIADPTSAQDNDILLSANANTFEGRLHAPGGTVEISGDDYDITGALSGWKVLINGDGHSIGDGTK